MSILADKSTKVLIQGITGTQASFHVRRSIDYGTNIVAGVTPGKGGIVHLGVPVFDSVREAVVATDAEATVLFVPARSVKSAVKESVEAGLKLIVCISDGVPVRDMLEVRAMLQGTNTVFVGPNTPGIITPDEARLGIFPENIHTKGKIGIISRSSTLTYEVVLETGRAGEGQSTVVGLGDDMVIGMDFIDALKMFHEDKETEAIIVVGQMGGQFEEQGAEWYAQCPNKKPVIGFIAGNDVTFLNHIGYAGDIITRGRITAEGKKKVMKASGMIIVDTINQIHKALSDLMK